MLKKTANCKRKRPTIWPRNQRSPGSQVGKASQFATPVTVAHSALANATKWRPSCLTMAIASRREEP
ncbi:unnamed protein product [Chondrus crispus]|uniref:Uncharacterized protein n=1 Tax=Chondrus crispus TaxID=2769 RepID=R7QF45_CHOCR|nr:unnamed protein product [Chondrus crispus]CDF36714.1 unnamed protein product [Chondrus crispus]|eukprot:XP_005716533.1 unnamed protein product [Chondrus crispus]